MSEAAKPFFLQALDALKAGDRRGSAALISKELRQGNTSAKNLESVSQLAAHIGEIELAIEAARRGVAPGSIGSLLAYWAVLATYGRSDEALADLARQPVSVRDHPFVLHFRGTVAQQFGRFDEAQELFRRTLAKTPTAMQTWFALAMVKTFDPDDADLTAMEQLERQPGAPPDLVASLCYAIGKAREDIGDNDAAFEAYAKGAAIRRQERPFDTGRFGQSAEKVIRDFTPGNLKALRPSGVESQRSLFVTGLPRSGTTLTEQLLLGHSAVADGAELNLFATAMIPVPGGSLDAALAYEQRSNAADPWGEIGIDYARLIDLQFRSPGLVVDKSLGQSLLIGLMLHALPNARIAWLRRAPDDVALSCFKTYFTTGLPWTWSLTDIADVMRIEDSLFDHWRALYPDRILTVPYEDLVASPAAWSERLQQHFGLAIESGVEQLPRDGRAIRTASVGQARQPISTSRIGQSAAFERQLKPFRERYYA